MKTFGYITRLVFYFGIVGISVFACMVSSKLTERMWEINNRYTQLHHAVHESEGYNALSVKTKEEMAILTNRVRVGTSIMEDVEMNCILIAVIVTLIAIVLFILDTLKFLKGSGDMTTKI